MNILGSAVGFGLGPNGKLCSIVNQCNEANWYACGDEIDLSIYKKNPFLKTCWSKNSNEIKEFIKENKIDIAINVLDPELAIMITDIGIPVIYIDSLPFMWNKSDLIPNNVAIYCAQKYPNYILNPALKDVKNLVWIDPIVTDYEDNSINNKIVLNFGGLHSPFGEGKEYLTLILNCILPHLPENDLCVTGGKNVVNIILKDYPNINCKTYSHNEYLKMIAGCKMFITSPGLTTIYETCHMDINTVILPPQNLSQFFNSKIAYDVCKNVKIIDWHTDCLSPEKISSFVDVPETYVVKYIYKQIEELSNNKEYTELFNKHLSSILYEKNFKKNTVDKLKKNGVLDIINAIKTIY